MNYSLVAEKLLDLCLPDSRAARVALPHPISHDQAILRPALFPQMIDTLGRNRARQAPEAALFEFGKVYFKKDDAAEELDSLAIGLMGPVGRGALDKRRPVGNEEMLLWLKGILAALFAKMNVRGWTLQPETGRPEFQAGAAWSVTTADGALGSLGLVRPELRAEWRLADPVAVAELRVDRLLRHAYDLPAVAVPNPYPCVERDIALLVAPGVSHDDIAGVLRAAAPPELEAVALFDVYRGAALGGRQSMAYALTFRAKNKTLTDDEVNRYFDNIKNALRAGLPVEIRDT
jgi:phenylalanyl-tRNA synthetase beta chain